MAILKVLAPSPSANSSGNKKYFKTIFFPMARNIQDMDTKVNRSRLFQVALHKLFFKQTNKQINKQKASQNCQEN